MAQCFDAQLNQYVYCSAGFGTYIAVGIVLPIVILLLTILVSAFLRYKRNRLRREQQQANMATVVPIYNTDVEQPVPYNYSYPPNYASITDSSFDKPPSYEQTVHYLPPMNNTSDGAAAILPVTPITTIPQPAPPLRKET